MHACMHAREVGEVEDCKEREHGDIEADVEQCVSQVRPKHPAAVMPVMT